MNKLQNSTTLMSHPLCPHNQRAVITLMKKGLQRDQDFAVDYVDLANLPERLFRVSPKGQMPVLIIDDQPVSTDAMRIAEYLNEEIAQPNLYPVKPLAKLAHREFLAKADAALNLMRDVYTAKTSDALDEATEKYFAGLKEIQGSTPAAIFENASREFSLADAAWGGFFSLAFYFDNFRRLAAWENAPKLHAYGKKLYADETVQNSRCPNYNAEFTHFFGIFDSEFPRRFST